MVYTDFQAYEYPEMGFEMKNKREFRRDHYWDDALEASLDAGFL